jgi:adenylate cyclase
MQIAILAREDGGESSPLKTVEDVWFPLELGRQDDKDEPLFVPTWKEKSAVKINSTPPATIPVPDRWRLVIAPARETQMGRHHALLDLSDEGEVKITNISTFSTIILPDGTQLTGARREGWCPLPPGGLQLTLGPRRVVRLKKTTADEPKLVEVPQASIPPESDSGRPANIPPLPPVVGIDPTALIGWLRNTLAVLQSADFYPQAAQGVITLADMDSGGILLREEGEWKTEPEATVFRLDRSQRHWQPSRRILARILADKKAVYQLPPMQDGSYLNVEAIVAAPILNPGGEVIGVLYGDRRQAIGHPITEVEALLVELLASGVAAGLVRLEHEKAIRTFEGFFTPQLARHLAAHEDMLRPSEADVTILFCDIRGFSRISEQLGAAKTIEWISDVMAELSECVADHQGVLVDYIGDELMAMWGAPEKQADHAILACRAARAMLDRIPVLNARWEAILKEPMGIGIGLNSGKAQVGNTGSPRKFKYGPLGNTVNLASRVQGATKHAKAPLLITQWTHDLLDAALKQQTRRICQVKVVNIKEPVTLYELPAAGGQIAPQVKADYEKALGLFEGKNFRGAARLLAPLVAEAVNDGPSLVLMYRAVQGLKDGPAPGHPVWELESK